MAANAIAEIEALTHELFKAFTEKDVDRAVQLLSNDLQVFDHVPYRFDNKQQFVDFLRPAMEGIEVGVASPRQLSCRVFNDAAAVANTYDTFTGITKTGTPINAHGRTTLVFAKEDGDWKIVSAHFSPLPTAG